MPTLVRNGLFIGDINDAAEVLCHGSSGITHVLSLLSSASISFFSDWQSSIVIPTKEIRRVFANPNPNSKDRSVSQNPSFSLHDQVPSSQFPKPTPEHTQSLASGSQTRTPCSVDKAMDKLSLKPDSSSGEKLLFVLEMAGQDLKLARMAVPLRDMESENLLDYLEVCLDFINKSRADGGTVLVHCFAGVSRSAAVITAYLMRTEQLSQEDALESLRQCCESVCPNDGFLDQLKMFEEMGFKVDPASSIYKHFHLKRLGDAYIKGEKIDSIKFGADPGALVLQDKTSSQEQETTQDKPKLSYRCKKCRRVVALEDNVLAHMPGEGETCFGWQKRKSGNPFGRHDEHECSSIFVEPLKWMTNVEEGAIEGKLLCVHCEARLGYFNWSGIQCSCGSWVTPAFQLHKSRIDISTA
ncbi:hypothetical protein AMTRI_Chr01g127510 [Amborella trichopoda]